MAKSLIEWTVRNWEHIVQLASKFDVGSPLKAVISYRGQAIAQWPLVPSLVRVARDAGLNAEQTLEVEEAALTEFQKQGHLHLPSHTIPERNDIVSWWALMQHYNTPTRLLDWTGSLYVALYFAVIQEVHQPGAVWVAAPYVVNEWRRKNYSHYEPPETAPELKELLLNPKAEPVLYFLERKTQTDRMYAQRTGFSVSPKVLVDHGQIIAGAIPDAQGSFGFWKLIIPANLKVAFMLRLRSMNVTAGTLFPGIDGLGRSVSELIRLGCFKPSSGKEDDDKGDTDATKGGSDGTTR